jgi:hypothetical protein
VQLKASLRLPSRVSATEVVVVKAPLEELDLRCGGHARVRAADASDASTPTINRARTVALSSARVLGEYNYSLRRTFPEFNVGEHMLGAKPAESRDGFAAFAQKTAPPVPKLSR